LGCIDGHGAYHLRFIKMLILEIETIKKNIKKAVGLISTEKLDDKIKELAEKYGLSPEEIKVALDNKNFE
jgi:hypothetical protein